MKIKLTGQELAGTDSTPSLFAAKAAPITPRQNWDEVESVPTRFWAAALLLTVGFLWIGGPLALCAQSYRIDWYKISGGQGTSTNGQFSVTGTIGQQDAHVAAAGGNYSLTGGFWSFITAIQTPGSPELSISINSPQTALISWPAPSAGFVLQQNSTLNPGTWADVTNSVTSLPVVNQIEVTFAQGHTFYRLIHR